MTARTLRGATSHLVTLVLFILAVLPPAPAQAAANDSAQVVVHMLEYIGVDYPEAVEAGAIKNADEFAEMQEFTTQVVRQLQSLPAGPQRPALIGDAQRLAQRVNDRAPADEIAKLAADLRSEVIAAYRLVVAPQRPPDLSRAASQYATACVACHGAQGAGDGPAATGLNPPPSNFRDTERMQNRSLYGLYNTITLGVEGTSMAPFAALPEGERWALAFYVAGLGVEPARAAEGRELWARGVGHDVFDELADIAALSAADVMERHGRNVAAVHAFLISSPAALATAAEEPIAVARRLLAESASAYRRGESEAAQRLAVSAYLEGFELAEASLDAADPDLRLTIENEMLGLRGAMRSGAPVEAIDARIERIAALLHRAEELTSHEGLSPGAAALSAFIILLREGLEAILVLAAIAAFLVKANRRDAMRWVHLGWVAALVLGLVTWFAASYLIEISGANRELTEGFTALAAAGVLLYVGFWLHGKAYAQSWQRYIREKLSGALSYGTLTALGVVAFLAVYREVFETVLFYQALWSQAGPSSAGMVIVGFLGAAVALVVVAWAVFRYGVRLPIGPFFAISSILMALLAVVFAGKGVAALQASGHVPTDLVSFPRVPALGIFPTVQTLGAQAVLLVASAAGFVWSYLSTRQGAAERPVAERKG